MRSSNGLAFGASGTANGLVSNGVAYFLLIYYSQVVGPSPCRCSPGDSS